MGTRADFYVGTGEKAEWLGSVGWDGYEWAEDPTAAIVTATTEEEFRSAVKAIAEEREDWTSPEVGWPWPWDDSGTTDYTYYFDGDHVAWEDRDDWPNMENIKNVTFGKRSGVILVG